MQIIEITESKVEKMSDYAEKMLKYGGKLMQCIEELSGGESMGRRERYYDDDDERYDVVVMAVVPTVEVMVTVAAMEKDVAYVVQDAIPVIVNV
jgi:hypothetical protein